MAPHRALATTAVAALIASLGSVAPAHADPSWRNALIWRDARAQVCAEVNADGTAVVRVRMNNRKGVEKVSAGLASVRADGRPDRTLVTTKYVLAGRTSAGVQYGDLPADGRFFVDIRHMTDEGAGIVKTSARSFLVSDQSPC